jgi:hypothetical protein
MGIHLLILQRLMQKQKRRTGFITLLIQHAQEVEKERKALADTILDQVNDIALDIENANKKLWSWSNHPIRGTIVLLHLAMISKLLTLVCVSSKYL